MNNLDSDEYEIDNDDYAASEYTKADDDGAAEVNETVIRIRMIRLTLLWL